MSILDLTVNGDELVHVYKYNGGRETIDIELLSMLNITPETQIMYMEIEDGGAWRFSLGESPEYFRNYVIIHEDFRARIHQFLNFTNKKIGYITSVDNPELQEFQDIVRQKFYAFNHSEKRYMSKSETFSLIYKNINHFMVLLSGRDWANYKFGSIEIAVDKSSYEEVKQYIKTVIESQE